MSIDGESIAFVLCFLRLLGPKVVPSLMSLSLYGMKVPWAAKGMVLPIRVQVELNFPSSMSSIHSVFYVLALTKCVGDPLLIVSLENIGILGYLVLWENPNENLELVSLSSANEKGGFGEGSMKKPIVQGSYFGGGMGCKFQVSIIVFYLENSWLRCLFVFLTWSMSLIGNWNPRWLWFT